MPPPETVGISAMTTKSVTTAARYCISQRRRDQYNKNLHSEIKLVLYVPGVARTTSQSTLECTCLNPSSPSTALNGPGPASDQIQAAGIAPGDPHYLTGRARRAIRQADVIVGFETAVDVIEAETEADLLHCNYTNQTERWAGLPRVRQESPSRWMIPMSPAPCFSKRSRGRRSAHQSSSKDLVHPDRCEPRPDSA